MEITSTCAEELGESVQAAADAVRGLEDSVAALRDEVLNVEVRRAEGQRCLDEAARLCGAAQGIVKRLALWPVLAELWR